MQSLSKTRAVIWFTIFGLSFMGCDERLKLQRLELAGQPQEQHAKSFAMLLLPEYFAGFSGAPSEAILQENSLLWEGELIEESMEDGTLVQLGPFAIPFALESLELNAEDEQLVSTFVYQASEVETAIRLTEGANTTICSVFLNLGQRELEFTLRPNAAQGVAQWTSELRKEMVALEALQYEVGNECEIELEDLDWSALEDRINGQLAGRAAVDFLPPLVSLIEEELSLPRGGFTLLPVDTGYFQPLSSSILTRLEEEEDFQVSSEGLWLTLDSSVAGSMADCVAGLTEHSMIPNALNLEATTILSQAPENAAIVAAVDDSYLQLVLDQLVFAGGLCIDLELAQGENPAITSSSLLQELNLSDQYDFGELGRVRIQPLALPTITLTEEGGIELSELDLWIQVYASEADLLFLIADIKTSIVLDLSLESAAGVLQTSLDDVQVSIDEAALYHLDEFDLSPEQIVERIAYLLGSRLTVSLPQPAGKLMRVLELQRHEESWLFFLAFDE